MATERVVEYYFPEENKESRNQNNALSNKEAIKKKMRASAGATTKTTVDESLSESSGNELSKIRRKMKKLDINSMDDNLSLHKLESPKSQTTTLKKRRFR